MWMYYLEGSYMLPKVRQYSQSSGHLLGSSMCVFVSVYHEQDSASWIGIFPFIWLVFVLYISG